MPSIQNNLILVKGEDKTAEIVRWEFDSYNSKVYVTFKSGKSYPYNPSNVEFYKNPKVVTLTNQIVLKKENPCVGAKTVQLFDYHARIIYEKERTEVVSKAYVKFIDSALNSPESRNCFEYLKDLSREVGLFAEDGHNILKSRYDKINFIREDCILADFLAGELLDNKITSKQTVVFPFGFNLSQKEAVNNALNNRLSVIEGPPGTGKTQTILNIIANAVMRGETVAVVSSNNPATANVLEKMKKYEVDFIAASLGSSKNKKAFIQNQKTKKMDLSNWYMESYRLRENINRLTTDGVELDRMLDLKNEHSVLAEKKDALEKEYAHFLDIYNADQDNLNMPSFKKKVKASMILAFIAEYKQVDAPNNSLNIFKKFQWKVRYGLRNFKFWGIEIEALEMYCQNEYYIYRLQEIGKRLKEIEKALKYYDFDSRMKDYSAHSMTIFKAKLAEKYKATEKRRTYEIDDLRKHPDVFINDYPVILSTTYSLVSSLSSNFIYDYVIVDEASQVDLATGALALSCAKKAVIVGDLKQLPNVVRAEKRKSTDEIFNKNNLKNAYQYSNHSLLSSIVQLFPEVPRKLLREHYRCHPEIIGFCNQRFYNNELIILTKPRTERQALMVYKTGAGNHARGHVNQRQIDVIIDEVIKQQKLDVNDGSVGIVTPYRDQANKLQEVFSGKSVKADTADKFQGQECSVMIFSTVDNEIGEFASNPNRLNVAVSRAIDQFLLLLMAMKMIRFHLSMNLLIIFSTITTM